MPANWSRLQTHIEAYNTKPDRATPGLKYTDVINEALHRYFEDGRREV